MHVIFIKKFYVLKVCIRTVLGYSSLIQNYRVETNFTIVKKLMVHRFVDIFGKTGKTRKLTFDRCEI